MADIKLKNRNGVEMVYTGVQMIKAKDVNDNDVNFIFSNGPMGSLNIECNATTAPSDTSKLWVKTDTEPTKVSLINSFYGDLDAITLETVNTISTNTNLSYGTVGTKCYLFGGNMGSSIKKYNTETNTLTTLSATLSNYYCYGRGCATVGTNIYIFGGNYGSSSSYNNYSSIQKFNTETETIATVANMSNARGHMGCAAVGTKIYLFGGYYLTRTGTLSKYTNYNMIEVYDTESNTVNTLTTTLPIKYADMSCAAVGTKIYLFGGRTPDGSSSTTYNTIRVFNTENNTIQTLSTTLPEKNTEIGCAVIGTKIYLFSGSGSTRAIRVFDTETYELTSLSTTLPAASSGVACSVVGTQCYLIGGSSSTAINRFSPTILLPENELQITNDLGIKKVKIINNPSAELEISPTGVYIGNSNNQAQVVKAAIYDSTNQQWVEIN